MDERKCIELTTWISEHHCGRLFCQQRMSSSDRRRYLRTVKGVAFIPDVSKKLRDHSYTSMDEWILDINHVFDSYINYYGNDTLEADVAKHMKLLFEKKVTSMKLASSYEFWIDKLTALYSKVDTLMKQACIDIPAVTSHAETCLTDSEYEALSNALGTVTDHEEILDISHLMKSSGFDLRKAKKEVVNLRRIPPVTAKLLWKWAHERGKL